MRVRGRRDRALFRGGKRTVCAPRQQELQPRQRLLRWRATEGGTDRHHCCIASQWHPSRVGPQDSERVGGATSREAYSAVRLRPRPDRSSQKHDLLAAARCRGNWTGLVARERDQS